jgi:hypothetical protein
MSPIHDPRRGIRLIDWMVGIAVIALAWGVIVPILKSSRSLGCRLGCRPQCQNNMRLLGLAMLNFSTTKGRFPNAGTIRDDPKIHQGDPTKSNLYLSIADPAHLPDGGRCWLSNWVVEVLPYLDYQDMANDWDQDVPYWWPQRTRANTLSNRQLSETSLRVLGCPDNRRFEPGSGRLGYVVNGGFMRWPAVPIGWTGGRADGMSGNGPTLRWGAPPNNTWLDSQDVGRRLGVMFLGTDRRSPSAGTAARATVSRATAPSFIGLPRAARGRRRRPSAAGSASCSWARNRATSPGTSKPRPTTSSTAPARRSCSARTR